MTIYQDVFANSSQPGNVLVNAVSAIATQIITSSLVGFSTVAAGQVARIAIQDTATSPIEIVWATGQSGNTFTVLRGQEGTTATAHVQGAAVAQVITAGVMNNLYPTVVDQTANGNFTWPLTSAGIPAQKVVLNQAAPQAANVSINPALFIPGQEYTLTDGGNNGQGIAQTYAISLVPTSGLIAGQSSYTLITNGESVNFFTDNNQANFWISASGNAPAFSAIGSGANTTAAMVVGTGASLSATGTGSIAATSLPAATATTLGSVKPDGTIITVASGAITVAQATPSAFGVVKPDGTIITDTAGVITVAKASASAFGVVEVDNTTITSASGVISAVQQLISPRRKSTIVLEGHSFVAHNSTVNSSFGSVGTAPVGNGYTYSWGVFEQAMIACNYPFRVLANNGVGGNTTSQILTRIPGDLALNPGWIYLDVLTNDALNQVALSTTIANVLFMLQQCNAANVGVIFALDGARKGNSNANYTQAQITLATEAANYFKDYALDNPNVIIFDQAPFRWDTTSLANSLAYTPLASVVESDGVHPNPYGAWLSGTQGTLSLGAILAPFLWGNQFYTGPSAGSDGSANGDIQNIVENPLLCGTGGTAGTGCTGTVPTNCTIGRTGTGTTSVVASIVQRSSLASTFPGLYDDGCFGNVAVMQISGGSALTQADSAQIQFTPVGSGNITSLSGPWEIECEVAAIATSGTIAEIMLTAFINSSNGGYTMYLNADQAGWGGDPMNIPTGKVWQGKLRSRPFYAPANAIVGGANTQLGINASPSVGGAMTLYVSNPKWRLIQA